MIARELMTSDPALVLADDTVATAAELMRTRGVGMLPVVDSLEVRRLIGVITDRDIVVRHVAFGHGPEAKVRTHMSAAPLITVMPATSPQGVAEKMMRFKVRRLPVVDAADRVVGIVTQADLARRIGPDDPELVERVVEAISSPGALVA